MATLQEKLKELMDKVDTDFVERIDTAPSMRSVDRYHDRAQEMLTAIKKVAQLAELYDVQ